MDISVIAPYIAGPASAVFVLLIVLYGLYKIFDKHLAPLMKDARDSIKDGFKDIANEMKEDRKEHRSDMIQIMKRVDVIEDSVSEIKKDISVISKRLDDTRHSNSKDKESRPSI